MNLRTDKCQYCNETIYLFRVGVGKLSKFDRAGSWVGSVGGGAYRWLTNVGNRNSWKCSSDQFPVRCHEPLSRKERLKRIVEEKKRLGDEPATVVYITQNE